MGRPKQFSRESVIEKALPLFWTRGYTDTSIQDLERVTGVNKSGLYSEFQDKDAIFLACLRHYYAHRGGIVALSRKPMGWDNIKSFLEIVQVRMCGKTGCFAVNSAREAAVVPHRAITEITSHEAVLRRLLIKNLRAARTKRPVSEVATLVMTFFHGACVEQNLRPSAAASNRKISSFLRIVRKM
jgi:TetR/AcrR family transcriptional regulator, copper-responsive repressor